MVKLLENNKKKENIVCQSVFDFLYIRSFIRITNLLSNCIGEHHGD